MTKDQTKAKRILEDISLRPYGRNVNLYIKDMSNLRKNLAYDETISDSLGNIVAYLFKVADKFNDFPDINKRLIAQICYNRSKTITVTKKKTSQKIKVVFKSQPINIADWPLVESNLWK